jgi:hypothetical protein
VHELTLKALRELRSFQRPPGVVKNILEATAVLLGAGDTQSWATVRRALQGNLLERIRDINLEEVTPAQFRRLRRLLALPDFDEEMVRGVCPTALPLARWCCAVGSFLENCSSTQFTDLEKLQLLSGAPPPGEEQPLELLPQGLAAPEDIDRLEPEPQVSNGSSLIIEPDLQKLSSEELRKVSDLAVCKTDVGSILFHGITDCTGLDIPSLVHLDVGEVLVYPVQGTKPPEGQGLNKRATVTMYQCWPPNGRGHLEDPRAQDKYRGKIQQMTEEKRATFIDYDCSTGVWKFQVEHF